MSQNQFLDMKKHQPMRTIFLGMLCAMSLGAFTFLNTQSNTKALSKNLSIPTKNIESQEETVESGSSLPDVTAIKNIYEVLRKILPAS